MKLTETITWHQPPAEMPDVDRTVLLHVPEADEPIWLGWWSGDNWIWAEGAEVEQTVAHWADLPTGPGGGK